MVDHSSPTDLTTAWHAEAVPAEVVVLMLPAKDGRRRRRGGERKTRAILVRQ
jgi:hypothetical protein